MIRPLLLVAVLLVGAGCSALPGFDRPQVDVAAHLALLQLRGRARMQSVAAGGGLQDNPAIDLQSLGAGERDDDIGGTLSVGDGFSGLEFGYLKVTMLDSSSAMLPAAFGVLAPGDVVRTAVEMDEFRVRYIAKAFEHKLKNGVQLAFGVGGALVHRRLDFFVKRDSDGTGQLLEIEDDGVPYAAARARGTYGAASLQLDWAHNFTADFGGDFDGSMQDIEITGRYDFPLQSVAVYGGWRRSDLPATGQSAPFAYATDFVLDGFFVGAQMRF